MTRKIFIIDDSSDSITLAEIALSIVDPDIRTESALNGERALELLKKAAELPVLILLDLKMPGMDGLETLRSIRADGRLKHIPVVIVTCSTLPADEKAAMEAGATGFIHKALRLKQMSKDLEIYLQKVKL